MNAAALARKVLMFRHNYNQFKGEIDQVANNLKKRGDQVFDDIEKRAAFTTADFLIQLVTEAPETHALMKVLRGSAQEQEAILAELEKGQGHVTAATDKDVRNDLNPDQSQDVTVTKDMKKTSSSEERFQELLNQKYGPKANPALTDLGASLEDIRKRRTELLKQVGHAPQTIEDVPDRVAAFMVDCKMHFVNQGMSLEEAEAKCKQYLAERTTQPDSDSRRQMLETSTSKIKPAETRFKELTEGHEAGQR